MPFPCKLPQPVHLDLSLSIVPSLFNFYVVHLLSQPLFVLRDLMGLNASSVMLQTCANVLKYYQVCLRCLKMLACFNMRPCYPVCRHLPHCHVACGYGILTCIHTVVLPSQHQSAQVDSAHRGDQVPPLQLQRQSFAWESLELNQHTFFIGWAIGPLGQTNHSSALLPRF